MKINVQIIKDNGTDITVTGDYCNHAGATIEEVTVGHDDSELRLCCNRCTAQEIGNEWVL
jgi:hypothetical protein